MYVVWKFLLVKFHWQARQTVKLNEWKKKLCIKRHHRTVTGEQARRQGGFEGVHSNPPFGLQKIFIYTVNCILSSLSFENGPVVLLLLRIATVQTNLVAATYATCHGRTEDQPECVRKLFALASFPGLNSPAPVFDRLQYAKTEAVFAYCKRSKPAVRE